MNKILLLILTFLPLFVFAGGSSFELKIINLEKINNDEYHFSFEPITTPYGQSLNKFNNGLNSMTVIIKFDCNQSFYTCTFNERNHSKSEHLLAIKKLIEQAKLKTNIEFGVISSGFTPIKNNKGFYRSNGLFLIHHVVYSYDQSHY